MFAQMLESVILYSIIELSKKIRFLRRWFIEFKITLI